MSDLNNPNEFEEYTPEEVPEEPAPASQGSGSNRNFLIAVGVIAGVFLLALIAMLVWWLTSGTQRQAARQTQSALVAAQNDAAALAATQQQIAFLQAQVTPSSTPPPTFTPAPTKTPVIAVATATAESPAQGATPGTGQGKAETPDPTLLATLSAGLPTESQAGGGAPGGGPTLTGGAARTATLSVLLTQVAANQGGQSGGAAAATATALPSTGFADEVGLPGLLGLGLGLIVLIFIARTLRLSTR